MPNGLARREPGKVAPEKCLRKREPPPNKSFAGPRATRNIIRPPNLMLYGLRQFIRTYSCGQ